MRRVRGAVGVKGSGMWWKGWDPPQKKKSFFCPQNDKFRCIVSQFLTGRKHGQSLEASGHGFYGSIAKRSTQKQYKNYPKIIQKFTVRPQRVAPSHRPEYATTDKYTGYRRQRNSITLLQQ